jgi:hypothetical protein
MRIRCASQGFCARKEVIASDVTITAVQRTVEDDHASS